MARKAINDQGRPVVEPMRGAAEQMRLYCEANPKTPSATQRPRLFIRDRLWVALLGPTAEEGVVGIGNSVENALRAFDTQYLAGFRPRPESLHPK